MKYHAFVDPSGGSHDSYVLAIARQSRLTKRAVLAGMWERRSPLNPQAVTEEFAATIKGYGLTSCTGDRYSAQWVVSAFRACGVTYHASEKSKSDIYLDFLSLANSGKVRIPRDARLRAQFQSLERRATRGGRDIVDHPPAGADDLANAVAGALCLAAATGRRTFFMPTTIELGAGPEPGTPWVDPHTGHDLDNASDDFDARFWHRIH